MYAPNFLVSISSPRVVAYFKLPSGQPDLKQIAVASS